MCRFCWQQIEPFSDQEAQSLTTGWPHFAYAPYHGLLRQWLTQTKYHQRRALARALGFYLGLWFAHFEFPIQAIIPIPLHALRRQQRGYNQAEELARGVAEALNKPFQKALERIRLTPPLHTLTAWERCEVLKDGFQLRRGWKPPRGKGYLLLVDDIYTTGATLAAAQRCFPTHVQGLSLTLARTERSSS